MTIRSLLAASLIACAATTAMAQGTGAEGYFEIYNNTTNNVIVGFYTNDGTGWSVNWLDGEIAPDGSATARFSGDSGPCDQTFQVGWLAEGGGEVLDEPIGIDICEASNVYLDDNEIFYD